MATKCDEVIAGLMKLHPAMKRTGLRAALKRRFPEAEVVHEAARGMIPDAFQFHEDLRILALIEVVDSNPITPAKAAIIYDLAETLGDEDWQLSVVVYDHLGGLVGEFSGYFFAPFYIDRYTRETDKDVLPAVRAALRDIERGERQEAQSGRTSADELADRL